jgi:hypothetical protein
MTPRGWRLTAATAVIATGLAGSPSASAGTPHTDIYRGSIIGEPSAAVEFHVAVSAKGKRQGAIFETAGTKLTCDDGSTGLAGFLPTPFPFRSARRFRGEAYSLEPGTAYETYLEVSGRLITGGRARGTLFFVSDVFDPSGSSGPNPDCGTPGEVAWTAERIP